MGEQSLAMLVFIFICGGYTALALGYLVKETFVMARERRETRRRNKARRERIRQKCMVEMTLLEWTANR